MPLSLTTAILHLGMMDGSAGVAISNDSFLTVCDERNWIQQFSIEDKSVGKMACDLDQQPEWFGSRKKDEGGFHEADLEGAARVGNVIYWISSHGYDEKPKKVKDRRVFFATQLEPGTNRLLPHGKVYRGLLEDLLSESSLEFAQLKDASKIEPKVGAKAPLPGGLNIESLCTAEDGKTLLIGFRNPIPGGKALVVPLENPEQVVESGGEKKAKFGKPIQLHLGGLGLRDMVWWKGKYLMIAGHYDSHLSDDGSASVSVPASVLYTWSGKESEKPEDQPKPISGVNFSSLNPEALIVFPNERVLILSDDGASQKKLPMEQTHFRSMWLEGSE